MEKERFLLKKIAPLLEVTGEDSFPPIFVSQRNDHRDKRIINWLNKCRLILMEMFIKGASTKLKSVKNDCLGIDLMDNQTGYIFLTQYDTATAIRMKAVVNAVFDKQIKLKKIFICVISERNFETTDIRGLTVISGKPMWKMLFGSAFESKETLFKRMQQDYVNKGYIYEPSVRSTIVDLVEREYRPFVFNKGNLSADKLVDMSDKTFAFKPMIDGEGFQSFRARYTMAQDAFKELNLKWENETQPEIEPFECDELDISTERLEYATSEDYTLEGEIEQFGSDVYLKDGTMCDVVIFMDETVYKTQEGLTIYHHGLFSLDRFPNYFPGASKWKYIVPLYYKGRCWMMSRNTSEPLVYPTNHVFDDPTTQRVFQEIIDLCLRNSKRVSFVKTIRNMSVMINGGFFSNRQTMIDYMFTVCEQYNPAYIFGFDRNAPFDNYGFKIPVFFVEYLEYTKLATTTYARSATIDDDRHFASYALTMGSVITQKIPYMPMIDGHDEQSKK